MPRDYNVDDILDEIRRKKQQEGPSSGDTYGGSRSPARGGYRRDEVAPPARGSRQAAPEDDYAPRPARRPSRPAQQDDYYAPRPGQRSSRPAPPEEDYTRPARGGYGARQEEDYAPRSGQRASQPSDYDDGYGASRAPRPSGRSARPAAGDEGGLRPLGSRRQDRPSSFQPREQQPERPARAGRGASPYGGGERQPRDNGRRAAESQPQGRRSAGTELPPAAPQKPRRTFEIIDERGPAPRGNDRQMFDFDQPDTLESERAQRAQQRRTREPEPPAAPQGSTGSFRFILPEDDAPPEDDFMLPGFDDQPEEPAYGSGFVDPADIPLPDGTRVDLPQQPKFGPGKGFTMVEGSTMELDAPKPAVRRGKKARRRDDSPEDIVRSQWQDSYAAQEQLEQERDGDDFASPQDAPYVAKDLKSIRMGLTGKLSLTAALAGITLYLALAMRAFPFAEQLGLNKGLDEGQAFMLPLITQMAPEMSPGSLRIFMIVNLVMLVLAAIVCSNVVGGGIAALCRLRADNDTPAALAVLGALVQGIVLAIMPEGVYESKFISIYFCVAIFALLFNLIGKSMLIRRVQRNFELITSDGDKYAFVQIQNRDFAREFARGLGPDVDKVAYSAPTGFFSGFLDKSYSSDYSTAFSRVVAPITLVGALLVGGVTGFLAKEANIAVSAFAAVLCVTAPFSGAIVPNLMLSKMSKRLTKRGAMLAGYESAEDYADTNAVILNDRDLFSPENVMLHGMKVFAEKRIDEAILDAASVILSCDGIMSGVFLNMVGGNRRLLKKVDSLMYEDSMGISAWVDGKRVLIGSRELMQNHEIDCPSKDFENRYTRDGRQVLYIANSGELSAMFVVSYNGDPDTADRLAELDQRGISLVVYSTDPNITNDLIALVFGVKRTHVKILPAKMHNEYKFLTRPKEKLAANGAHAGGLKGICMLLRAASVVRQSVVNATMVQLIGIIVGYGLVALMAFTGSLSSASYGMLILYNLAWLLITTVAASLPKR